MKPAPLRYHAPAELPEALTLLAEHGARAAPLAGGQSLMPAMNMRAERPHHVVDINRLPGLDAIHDRDGALEVGALVRHRAFAFAGPLDPTRALLAETEPLVGHPPIRERGTFVGSIALNAPAAEWCVVAALLDATIVATSLEGDREVPVDDFFVGPFTTSRRPDELLSRVRLTTLQADHRVAFVEQARTIGDFPLVCAAAAVRVVEGRLTDVRVAVGGVAPTARRLEQVERAIEGSAPADRTALTDAASLVTDIAGAGDEPYGSADYKRHLGSVLARRAVERSIGAP